MLISYNWLKWYIPEAPSVDKLVDIFNYHICEVEDIEKKGDDDILDIKILPNRAHDLLSHQGIARELASFLNIKYVDPVLKYKIPASAKATAGKPELKIDVEIDGATHLSEKVQKIDKKRDEFSVNEGWTVVRFTAKRVRNSIKECIEELKKIISNTHL